MSRILQRVRGRVAGAVYAFRMNRRLARAPIDPRVRLPCYKSLDEYVDVDRLKSLDGHMIEKLQNHMATNDERFLTGPMKLRPWNPTKTGSRTISLTSMIGRYDFLDIDKPEKWQPTKWADEFSPLMSFIETLPFTATGRILIIYDAEGRKVTAHRDHCFIDLRHEFIWFRTNLTKKFYVCDAKTKRKKYVESYSAWFDTVNQYHGCDASRTLTFSVRVDGVFSEDFRRHLPTVDCNAASTASLWASLPA